jgi:hypothetical protein
MRGQEVRLNHKDSLLGGTFSCGKPKIPLLGMHSFASTADNDLLCPAQASSRVRFHTRRKETGLKLHRLEQMQRYRKSLPEVQSQRDW